MCKILTSLNNYDFGWPQIKVHPAIQFTIDDYQIKDENFEMPTIVDIVRGMWLTQGATPKLPSSV